MEKSLNNNTGVIFILVLISCLLLLPQVIAQEGIPHTEKGGYTWFFELLKQLAAIGLFSAFFAFLFSSFMVRRRDNQQSRSLITAFLAEIIYNFRRCVLYYGQFHLGGVVSKSSLYELTDAGALSNFANVVDSPEVISNIVDLKAHYYQIKRYTDTIASQIAERDQLRSQIVLLKEAVSRAGGGPRKDLAEEVERLSSEEGSLGKAIGDAQGTALAFFDYERVVNHIGVILDKTKKLMPKRKVVAEWEKIFRNSCSAKDFVDERKNEMPELGSEEWKEWRQSAWEEFERKYKA